MKVLGVLVALLALVVMVVPTIFNCQQEGKMIVLGFGGEIPMRCYWTAQAELGVGALLLPLGGLLALSRRRETQRYLSITGVGFGALVLLLPTRLIGVCGDMVASCNLIMRPSMILAGTLIAILSLVSLAIAWRAREEG